MTTTAINNGAVTAAKLEAGAQVGGASTTRSDSFAISSIIPADNTIPQVSEGSEVLKIDYTPKMIGSKLVISSRLFVSPSGADSVASAIFASTSTNAIGVAADYKSGANQEYQSTCTAEYITTSLSPVTISVRAGGANGSVRINGVNGLQRYGGAIASSLTISEVKQ